MENRYDELQTENRENVSMKTDYPTELKNDVKKNLSQSIDKIKNLFKEKLNRKNLVTVGLIFVVLIGAFIGINYATNNHMTPIRSAEKLENKKTVNMKSYLKTGFKNMGANNTGEIVNILYESDDFVDMIEELKEVFEENYESNQDNYGDNFKITYAVEDKIKLENSDLRDYQKKFRNYIKYLKDELEECEDFSSNDWGDFADDMGLSRTQAKKFVSALSDMVDDIGRLEITDGYELDVVRTVTGNMLDEPEETSSTIRVVKVNGRWIIVDSFIEFYYLLDF